MKSFLEPFKDSFVIKILSAILIFLFTWFTNTQVKEISKYKAVDTKIYKEIVKMDSIYFTAYNNCDMETQASL